MKLGFNNSLSESNKPVAAISDLEAYINFIENLGYDIHFSDVFFGKQMSIREAIIIDSDSLVLKWITKKIIQLMETLNVANKMTDEQCLDFAHLLIWNYPHLKLPEFQAYIIAFRTGKFRGRKIAFRDIFNHIDEQVLFGRLDAFIDTKNAVIAEIKKSLDNKAEINQLAEANEKNYQLKPSQPTTDGAHISDIMREIIQQIQ